MIFYGFFYNLVIGETMFNYPIKFSFSAFAVTPTIQIQDASGNQIISAAKKLISSKDEIDINVSSGTYKVISQESRITEIPSNWDVLSPSGQNLGVIDDDFVSALENMNFSGNSVLDGMMQMQAHRSMNLRYAKMYWLKDTEGNQLGFITPDPSSLLMTQIPLYSLIKDLPFAWRLITPSYYIQLGDKTVMTLKKERTFLVDTYTLTKVGEFGASDEAFLVCSAILAVVYERQQLRSLYT
jgi:uncharacterized protein YxjI